VPEVAISAGISVHGVRQPPTRILGGMTVTDPTILPE
jgi:hypothetical protein